jgi:hypothetical protein
MTVRTGIEWMSNMEVPLAVDVIIDVLVRRGLNESPNKP